MRVAVDLTRGQEMESSCVMLRNLVFCFVSDGKPMKCVKQRNGLIIFVVFKKLP